MVVFENKKIVTLWCVKVKVNLRWVWNLVCLTLRQEMWFEGVWVQDFEKKKLEERGSYRRLREVTNDYVS